MRKLGHLGENLRFSEKSLSIKTNILNLSLFKVQNHLWNENELSRKLLYMYIYVELNKSEFIMWNSLKITPTVIFNFQPVK